MNSEKCKDMQYLFERYITGEITPEEAEDMKKHMKQCDECKEIFESTQALMEYVEEVGVKLPEEIDDRLNSVIPGIALEARQYGMKWARWIPSLLVVPLGVFILFNTGFSIDHSLIYSGIGLNVLGLLTLPFIARTLAKE
jgi:predicted anti-sigma-YlaC factor YlaD